MGDLQRGLQAFDYDRERMAGLVAPHLRLGLDAYIMAGRPTGDGLRSVISNERVFEVVGRLDEISLASLPGLLKFLYNFTPAECWGSEAAYDAWCAKGGLEGGA